MFSMFTLPRLAIICLIFTTSMGMARDYIIYSISQDLPMGLENEIIKKNYYVNIGKQQGLKEGTVLDVIRTISRLDPYETKKRYNYNVNIGKLKVLHTENSSSIARMEEMLKGPDIPYLEIDSFIIGDKVDVHINKAKF